MSLTSLPEEPLAKIASHLNHTDRETLSLTHPILQNTLSPHNKSFWHDVYATRFQSRKHQTTSPESLNLTNHERVVYHDLADDYLIHHKTPTPEIFPGGSNTIVKGHSPRLHPNHAPKIFPLASALHVAHSRTYCRIYQTRDTFFSDDAAELDAEATCLSADHRTVVVGLRNGVVMTRLANQSHGSWRRLRGHSGSVLSVALMNDVVISGGSDRTIRVRRTRGSTRTGGAEGKGSPSVMRGHGSGVSWLGQMGSGQVASHGGDERVKLWDICTRVCVSTGRVGVLEDIVCARGVLYAGARGCVQVLDARVGFASSVGTLSLPTGWRGVGIGRLVVCEDGAVAATVGGGGVAIWDARGPWEARGLGWQRRWEGDAAKSLQAVAVDGRTVIAGGGVGELLTFARGGGYEGVVCEIRGGRFGAVEDIMKFGSGFVVSRVGGAVYFVDGRSGVVDWSAVQRVAMEERGDVGVAGRFWDEEAS